MAISSTLAWLRVLDPGMSLSETTFKGFVCIMKDPKGNAHISPRWVNRGKMMSGGLIFLLKWRQENQNTCRRQEAVII